MNDMPAKVTQLIKTLVLGQEATSHQFIVECSELEVHNDWRGVSRTLKEIINTPNTIKQHISYFELQDQQEVQD
jgi:CRISPR/Cas system endoribonuclease Cas6 (RAMP superfamily)